jgi:hypothetical protein
MKNEYYETPKSGKLMQLFWKAAGADRFLLERSTYSEQVKYFCMGGIVIATGVMASLAGGYAFYTIFSPKDFASNKINIASEKISRNGEIISNSMDTLAKTATEIGTNSTNSIDIPTVLLSIVFGLIWGLIIFNIDRFIVTSTGKGDGTEAITWQEFKSAIPRIIMGAIIAMTISKPIEIRMFQSEIITELNIKQNEYFELRKKQIDIDFEGNKKIQQEKIDKKDSILKSKEVRYVQLENTFNAETGGERGARGLGPEAKAIQAQMIRLENEIKLIRIKDSTYINSAYSKINEIENERNKKISNAIIEAKGKDGLLERIKIAHEIGGWISVFITLLFLVIELTPIFFKMMLIKGPYDYMDENVKDLAIAEYGIEVTSEFYEDKNGNQITKTVNHAAEIKKREKILLLRAQEELNEQIINNWKEKKSKEIDENPDAFIQES